MSLIVGNSFPDPFFIPGNLGMYIFISGIPGHSGMTLAAVL